MNRNQRAALANPNLEFGASTFLGIPVGPNQLLLVYQDKTEENNSFILKSLYVCPDGTEFPKGDTQGHSDIEMAVLPSNFETLQVTDEAFTACTGLKNIIGLENLEKIPINFCAECDHLEFSRLNATVINEAAFPACFGLTRIELPNVTDIRAQAFESCVNLTVVLNDNVESVAESAFAGIADLIYHGSLPGAPWGAKKWNGVPQS